MQNRLHGRVFMLAVTILALAGLALGGRASAASLQTLYNFCSQGTTCTDGRSPVAPLTMDKSGNLYGTTPEGGAHNYGAVFELTANGTETVLYSFCPPPVSPCTSGAQPNALLIDASGNLYGTTYSGGARGGGTVFELTPNAATWNFTVLYNLGSSGDGAYSFAGLVMDASGNLYGTTSHGGAHGAGAVFELTLTTSKTWTEKVLYSFCSQGGGKCTDGEGPYYSGVILDNSGNLYGTTIIGGLHGYGVVYELAPPSGTKTSWTETVLYDFCSQGGAKCTDGDEPVASLLMDNSGILYGTATRGGSYNGGVVFELKPDRSETVLWSFALTGGDGNAPWSDVIMDGSGSLYGTTNSGGIQGGGTIFKLTPNGTTWTEALVSFCLALKTGNVCPNGTTPYAGLIMDKSGNLYGTTAGNGAHDGGTVFAY